MQPTALVDNLSFRHDVRNVSPGETLRVPERETDVNP